MEFIKNKYNIIKVLYIISAILFVTPSIIYLINNKTVAGFNMYFEFCMDGSNRIIQTLIYIGILTLMTIFYVFLIKKRKKLFKSIKEVMIFVAIATVIFLFSVPCMCSDIFYYLGVGRIDSEYGQNPYYTTIKDYVENGNEEKLENDSVLNEGYENVWSDSTVVYGAVWTLICRMVAGISFGNIDIGLLIFKILNGVIHLINCYLIYKITGKKIFSIIYGLNPFMLIEGIMGVHNDIFVVMFVLIALYFVKKKNNLYLAVTFLAIAAAIKYFAILLLPFFIIYFFRNENWKVRLANCFKYGMVFAIVFIIPYLVYLQDINVLKGLTTQQDKIAKSFYVILRQYVETPSDIVTIVKDTLFKCFVIIYATVCITLLFKKNIKFRREMQKAEYMLAIFLFLLITNFQPWYIMWLFPLAIWQKSYNIKLVMQISIISQFANSIFLALSEAWTNGTPFVIMIATLTLACILSNKRIMIKMKNKLEEKKE